MVQGDGTVVWNDGGNFSPTTQHHFQNHSFSISDQVIKIKFSPDFNQEIEVDSSEESSTLGLSLNKTQTFLSLIEKKLFQSKQNNSSASDNNKAKMEDFMSQPMSEKLKASNFPASYLRIGIWERISKYEGDLVAKCYYAKRKLVWEVLDGALKSKIEIQWTDIVALRAATNDREPGILEIELNQPPLFFREINPQPRKHTLWQQAHDFTGGQAPICRRHYVKFLPGILNRHYDKLLQCDPRLLSLSQQPFPSYENPYFYENICNFNDFNRCRPEFLSALQYPPQNFSQPLVPPYHLHNFKGLPPGMMASNSPMSVMDFSHKRSHNNATLENERAFLLKGSNHVFDISTQGDHYPLVNPIVSYQKGQLLSNIDGRGIDGGGIEIHGSRNAIFNEIENQLLDDSQDHLDYEHEEVTNDPMILSAIDHSCITNELLCSKSIDLLTHQDSDEDIILHPSKYPCALSGHATEHCPTPNPPQAAFDKG